MVKQGSDRRRLLGNMASLFTLQGANYLLPLITLPYLVRVLGPEKFGLIAFAQAFIQYFVVLTDYGFNLSATREVAVNRDNPVKLGEIISSVLLIKLILMLLGALILGIFVFTIPMFHSHAELYLVVYLTVIGNTLFPTWLFQGLERMRDITWMNVAARLITTAAIFLFIHDPLDYLLAAGIQSLPVLLAALPAWWVLGTKNGYSLILPNIKSIRGHIVSGWHVFLSTAAINVYTSSNTFVLGLIAGPVSVGYFSAANKISGAILGLYQPINQTLYPHISILFLRSKDQAILFIRKIIKKYIVFGFVATLLTFVFAKRIVLILLGTNYMESVPILKCLAFLPLIITFGHLFGGLTMLPLGMKSVFSRIVFISMLVDLILILPLIYTFGALGPAITTLCAEVCVSSLVMFTVIKHDLLKLQQVSA